MLKINLIGRAPLSGSQVCNGSKIITIQVIIVSNIMVRDFLRHYATRLPQ